MNCDKCGIEIENGTIVQGRAYCLQCALTPEVLAAAQAVMLRKLNATSGD